jgi:hypothetical protein
VNGLSAILSGHLELDVNPLMAFPDGAIAVDARVRVKADHQ